MSRAQSIASQQQLNPQLQLATLGGGCFWCLEAAFEQINGVIDVESGYAGSDHRPASYEAVCTGATGLAEVVQVLFDPALISYESILNVFFSIHDPTTLNRQGADKGTQYRSVIYSHSTAQAEIARAVLGEVAAIWGAPIVTELTEVNHYSRAEDYHQEYFRHHPQQGYCQAVISPKLAKLRAQHSSLLKSLK
ncbi:MAG: peptide-methionine (S)-S-oxide reductase MsrA [Formosimonas sp.]|jgi:peptide-methionine (S)-S-oxide reductase